MTYRSKDPVTLLAQLDELAARHKICSFVAVDNIMDLKYVRNLFARIEEDKLDYSFFYEVKANLNRKQIQQLYRGGVRRVQPGIESLSTAVLKLMRKGTSVLHNVRCLKWCRYYGIGVNWNLLWGFPGETEADYARELDVLRLISHLEPPLGSGRIWLERFSPNYFDDAFPVSNMRPEASYEYVYPPAVDLAKAAYFFDYEMGSTLPPSAHTKTHEVVTEWRRSWNSPERHSLTYRRTGNGLLLDRNHGPDDQGTVAVTGENAILYERCTETMRTPEELSAELGSDEFPGGEVRAALDAFCRAGLMIGENDNYLGLALPSNPNW